MGDYGHDVLFGTFLTPDASSPAEVVSLARLAERVGFDLATFQDHPYHPGFLDTSTLLSYVAAQTATIRLAPAQAVQALGEAIDVIRAIWAGDERGGVRVDGEFHRVVGAKRGPKPAHDIEIWLGAYKPRMLALTGRVADGWLPSLTYLPADGLAAANSVIDEAAADAGRSPTSIRRLLNISGTFGHQGSRLLDGPPAVWAEQLADLALGNGFSVFILGTDDTEVIRRFAAEVAPAVREQVHAERDPGTAKPAPSSATASVSASTVWDESTRPAGPSPDPDRGYTPHETARGQHLVDVHDALRGELRQIYDLMEQVAAGSMDVSTARSHLNTMTLRQNNWTLGTYCESYCRIVTTHHMLEDQSMFPHLLRADPRLEPVIDRLQEEHLAIHDVLEGVDRALVAFVTVPDGMPALRKAVDLLNDTLLSHLSYEEQELVEPLARLGLG